MYISTLSGHSGRGTGSTPMTVQSLFPELCVVKAGHSKPKDVIKFSFLIFFQYFNIYEEKIYRSGRIHARSINYLVIRFFSRLTRGQSQVRRGRPEER